MSIVTLVSGGLDSSLMAILAKENGQKQYPLFIDYGQLAAEKEWETCQKIHIKYDLPTPTKVDISGFGKTIPSGITNINFDIKKEAFLPGRNLIFLIIGAAYAIKKNAHAVCIGLLNEYTHIFPDQTNRFLYEAERIIEISFGQKVNVVAPLMDLYKKDVINLAKIKGINGTYSCHSGRNKPCGKCISCEEFNF